MGWTIPFQHSKFSASRQQRLDQKFVVDELDVLWGALTVGRPNRLSVYAHGQFSIDEAIYRIGVVRANLRLDSPGAYLTHSPAFDALDPTEKGWINFQLGMIFAKIFAAKYLDLPWLMHFKWFASNNAVAMKSGGSTPDFVGENPATGEFHVLEAKGRVSGFSSKTLREAQEQAAQALTVSGQVPVTRVGTLLHRFGKVNLAFACRDPDSDDKPPVELKETLDTWRNYYQVVWDLHNMEKEQQEALQRLTGLSVRLVDPVADYVGKLMSDKAADEWQKARDAIKEWSADQGEAIVRMLSDDPPGRRIFADGLELQYQPPAYK